MKIFPAIDIREGKVVRLFKGDYNQMTVYGDHPVEVAKNFQKKGAKFLHVVDLDGAKEGATPNFEVIKDIIRETNLKVEIGGGIRSEEVIKKYLDCSAFRLILGTIAIKDPEFTKKMVNQYGKKIAVGVDVFDKMVAIQGWTETSDITLNQMLDTLEGYDCKTVICTDISKDGALNGINFELYRELSKRYKMDIIASGGVSSIKDVENLSNINMYGAIIGKALYTGDIDLKDAVEVCK